MQSQKSAVASVQGIAPSFRYGSATRFIAGGLSLRVVDPPQAQDAEDVPIDPAVWLLDYYLPIVDLLEQIDTGHRGDTIVGILPGTEIEIGVPTSIAESVGASRERRLKRPAPRPASRVGGTSAGARSLYDQTEDPELRALTENIVASARHSAESTIGFSDGLLVRSFRG